MLKTQKYFNIGNMLSKQCERMGKSGRQHAIATIAAITLKNLIILQYSSMFRKDLQVEKNAVSSLFEILSLSLLNDNIPEEAGS